MKFHFFQTISRPQNALANFFYKYAHTRPCLLHFYHHSLYDHRLPQETQWVISPLRFLLNSQVSDMPILLTVGGGNFWQRPPFSPFIYLKGGAPILKTLSLNPNRIVRLSKYFFSCCAQSNPYTRIKVILPVHNYNIYTFYESSRHALYSDLLIQNFQHSSSIPFGGGVTSCLLLFDISLSVLETLKYSFIKQELRKQLREAKNVHREAHWCSHLLLWPHCKSQGKPFSSQLSKAAFHSIFLHRQCSRWYGIVIE